MPNKILHIINNAYFILLPFKIKFTPLQLIFEALYLYPLYQHPTDSKRYEKAPQEITKSLYTKL
jgi:hypothetical protein